MEEFLGFIILIIVFWRLSGPPTTYDKYSHIIEEEQKKREEERKRDKIEKTEEKSIIIEKSGVMPNHHGSCFGCRHQYKIDSLNICKSCKYFVFDQSLPNRNTSKPED